MGIVRSARSLCGVGYFWAILGLRAALFAGVAALAAVAEAAAGAGIPGRLMWMTASS